MSADGISNGNYHTQAMKIGQFSMYFLQKNTQTKCVGENDETYTLYRSKVIGKVKVHGQTYRGTDRP